MSPAEFWSRVLARRYQAAWESFEPSKGFLVNYRQLPDIVWESLLSHFGVARSNNELAAMQLASRFNATHPASLFVDDTARKQSQATQVTRAAVDEFVRPHYERLESLRRC